MDVGNTWATFRGLTPADLACLDSATSYTTEMAPQGTWVPPEPTWDGRVRLARRTAADAASVPTGLLDLALHTLWRAGVQPYVQDRRIRPEGGVPEPTHVSLRDYQEKAVAEALRAGRGILDMPPRAGKTRVGLELVRRLALPTLWIAPKTNIVTQTVRAADELLGKNWAVAAKGTTADPRSQVLVVTEATARMLPANVWKSREVVVMDEFHHAAASSYRKVLEDHGDHIFHRYGLTGTNTRSGDDLLALRAVLSSTVFSVTAQYLVERGWLVEADVILLPVDGPRASAPAGSTFSDGVGRTGIYEHEYRNALAAWAATQLWLRRRTVLILVGTKAQGWRLTEQLRANIPKIPGAAFEAVEFVSTDSPAQHCQRVIDAFKSRSGVQVLVGTSMVGEGTDLPTADALVYACGGKAEVSHKQAAYRPLTSEPGKSRAVIVDFADRHHHRLQEHSLERASTYYENPVFRIRVAREALDLPRFLDSPA